MRKKILTLSLLSLIAGSSMAFAPNNLNSCIQTNPAMNNYEPSEFSPSNNLLRPPGAREIYCGEKILLKLTLLDSNCIPLSDAKIYIWQVGCDGKYPYKPLKKRIDKELINMDAKSSFVGHGIATSDNLGKAHFLTIYPPSKSEDFINVRIYHSLFGEFQTKIKADRSKLKRMKDYDIMEETITLPWENIRKGY